jgi:Fe-S cluster assembly protein SufD
MIDIIEFYQNQAQKFKSPTPWLNAIKNQALDDFIKQGFPDKHNENWKYTSTSLFSKQMFVKRNSDECLDKNALETILTGRQSDCPIGIKIPIVNGVIMGLSGLITKLPNGVIVDDLSSAINKYPELVKPHLNKILKTENGFQSLNTALLNSGVFIYIPKDLVVEDAILLNNIQTVAQQAVFLRNLIIAEEGSSINIIEDFKGESVDSYFTNTVTEVFVGNFATVNHYKIQRESKESYHFGHVSANQMENSNFNSHLLVLGGMWSRSDTTINLQKSTAKCLLNGIYLPKNKQHMDQQTKVNHMVADCQSEQDYKGIVSDMALAAFNGIVFVDKHAKHTVAKQQNKNLLLSNAAEVYTKPQLNIYSDDVVCTHGATVGQLDEDALFYFSTRGINAADARRYLLRAFAEDNLTAINNSALSGWMGELINQHME